MSSMFNFVKSNGIRIDLTEKQVLQLSSKDRINAALADSIDTRMNKICLSFY